MKEEIRNIMLKFECPADWDSMPYVDGVKHCDYCRKKVYDFTDAKRDEFLKILAENNNGICGRFRADQLIVKQPNIPLWKKWLSAAMILIGVNIFNHKADAQIKDKPPTAAELIVAGKDLPIVMGAPIPIGNSEGNKDLLIRYDEPAKFPGLITNLFKKMKQSKPFSGRVVVCFSVNIDGTLSDYRILRGTDPGINNEVIKALKSSPKWEPAKLNGKPVKSEFTLPITLN